MITKIEAPGLAERAAAKQRELLADIAPMMVGTALAIGLVWPSCFVGVAVYGAVIVGALWAGLEALRVGAIHVAMRRPVREV